MNSLRAALVFQCLLLAALAQTASPLPSIETLQAAAKSDPKAAYQLGQAYAKGTGVPQNFEQAVDWFKKAAKSDPDAQYSLGFCYATGAGVKQNLKEATSWYLKAAKQGHAEARFKLAVCYDKGIGFLTANRKEALKWYRLAAEQGIAEAQTVVGDEALANRDYGEAYKWYELAAVRGVAAAQFQFAALHRNGPGTIPKNLVESYKWFLIAAKNGCEPAHAQMADLVKLYGVTEDQIAEAERKVSEFEKQSRPDGS